MFELKIEKPVPESKLPEAKKNGHFKHLAIYESVMKLPAGMLLPVVCETEEKAKKFGTSLAHASFASFRTFVRDKTVYIRLRNEKDEAERKHILELREKARQRKAQTSK